MWKHDPVPEECSRETIETKPKVEANGRRAVFDNAKAVKIQIINVDCWIKDSEGVKADHIISHPEIVDIVVELKGKDIRHAIQQIVSTTERWRTVSRNREMIGGLVICTRSPESAASLANRKKTLRDKNRIHLEVDKNGKTEYRFETFLGRHA